MEIRTGCSGWSYGQWVGPFYPSGTKSTDFLKLYSRIFDLVEIDSSFYGAPEASTVEKWKSSVPSNFSFTAKMPQTVTHDLRLRSAVNEARSFIDVIGKLEENLAMILIQLPPSLSYLEGHRNLKSLVEELPSDFRYAVEFRHNSWFVDDTFFTLRENKVCLAWAETPYAKVPPVITTDSVYLRLVGDRTINEEEFGKVLRDRSKEIEYWAKEVNGNEEMIKHAYVLSNNHFQGFGPATVNLFRRVSGLEPIDWTLKTGQTTLF